MTKKDDDMTYDRALSYMSENSARGSVLGLDNIKELMSRLSDVQDKLKMIHVAGTNGKGSTCAFLSNILTKAGYKVGRFTSPAVFSPLEIIKIGNRNITQKAYAAHLSKVRRAAEEMETHPTVFEMETALAFLYFYEEDCDVCVIECGMGGDKDATNVIKNPELSVITSVSMDHRDILGKSLGAIAEKKAGIIKRERPLVTFMQDEEVMEVISREASSKHSDLITFDPESDIRITSREINRTVFDLELMGETFRDLVIKLPGDHQTENAALAVAAALVFDRDLDRGCIRRGLKAAENPGRFEVLKKDPVWIADGAHNVDAALRFKETLTGLFPGKRYIFIMGVFADKDYEGILKIAAPVADMIITVHTPGSSRALPSYELARAAMTYCSNVTAADSIEEAIELAEAFAQKKDVVAAMGSLSFLGILKRRLKESEHKGVYRKQIL